MQNVFKKRAVFKNIINFWGVVHVRIYKTFLKFQREKYCTVHEQYFIHKQSLHLKWILKICATESRILKYDYFANEYGINTEHNFLEPDVFHKNELRF